MVAEELTQLRVQALLERSRVIQDACAKFHQQEAEKTAEKERKRLRKAGLLWEGEVTADDLRQAAEDQKAWLDRSR
ncbi:hypothetical protein ACFFLM_25850 [Deinococcus oregonensis]|uniref:Uncharacterized protein n=1 Tax=Deinococcus oregonensis TaxID=1805970 RepID=A0ABV6B6H4_9DEIO